MISVKHFSMIFQNEDNMIFVVPSYVTCSLSASDFLLKLISEPQLPQTAAEFLYARNMVWKSIRKKENKNHEMEERKKHKRKRIKIRKKYKNKAFRSWVPDAFILNTKPHGSRTVRRTRLP